MKRWGRNPPLNCAQLHSLEGPNLAAASARWERRNGSSDGIVANVQTTLYAAHKGRIKVQPAAQRTSQRLQRRCWSSGVAQFVQSAAHKCQAAAVFTSQIFVMHPSMCPSEVPLMARHV